MVELNAGAPRITRPAVRCLCASTSQRVRAHLEALGIAYRPRARPRPRPRLLHPDRVRVLPPRAPTASSRRSAAAAATTASSSCSAVSRRRGSGSGSASTGSSLALEAQGVAAAEPRTPARGRRRRGSRRHGRAAADRDATCAAPGWRSRADLGSRKLGEQLEAAARDGAHFAVIVGDELADGHVVLRDLGAASQKPVALADLPALLRRKAGT